MDEVCGVAPVLVSDAVFRENPQARQPAQEAVSQAKQRWMGRALLFRTHIDTRAPFTAPSEPAQLETSQTIPLTECRSGSSMHPTSTPTPLVADQHETTECTAALAASVGRLRRRRTGRRRRAVHDRLEIYSYRPDCARTPV